MSVDYLTMNNEIPEPAIHAGSKKSQLNLKDILRMRVTKLMQTSGLWREQLLSEIPVSWEKYDNFVIFSNKFFQHNDWSKAGAKLWLTIADLFQVENIALKSRIKNDEFRSPVVKVVYGESKLVKFKDNGIRYSWNVEQSMFCAGNVSERHRLAKLNCAGEVIADLFAGVGYFTLPFLLKAKCKELHACEWNPNSIEALKHNLEVNQVSEKCKIYVGDNRVVCPKNIADRVNLGLIPTSRDSWKIGCQALKSTKGGVIHVHENVNTKFKKQDNCECTDPTHICTVLECCICLKLANDLQINSDLTFPINLSFNVTSKAELEDYSVLKEGHRKLSWKRYEWFMWSLHAAHTFGTIFYELYKKPWIISALNLHHVKSYAPHIDHLVLDLECRPVNKSF